VSGIVIGDMRTEFVDVVCARNQSDYPADATDTVASPAKDITNLWELRHNQT